MSSVRWDRIWESPSEVPWAGKCRLPVYLDQLFEGIPTDSDQEIKIFFPLCGATKDMRDVADYLAKVKKVANFRVFGVDLIPESLLHFAKVNKLKPSKSSASDSAVAVLPPSEADDDDEHEPSGPRVCFENERFCLVAMDFFALTLEKGSKILDHFGGAHCMDFIVDVNAFIAMDPEMRVNYMKVLRLLAKQPISDQPGCRVFFQSYLYDTSLKRGPPHSVSDQDISDYWLCKSEDSSSATTSAKSTKLTTLELCEFSDIGEEQWINTLRRWGLASAKVRCLLITDFQ